MSNRIKIITMTILLIAMLATAGLIAKGTEEHKHHQEQGKIGHAFCPMQVKGAEIKVENTADGAVLRITSNDPKVVKRIQEQCAKMQEDHSKIKQESSGSKKFVCPMKCEGIKTYEKSGKCPKCNMDMEKKNYYQ